MIEEVPWVWWVAAMFDAEIIITVGNVSFTMDSRSQHRKDFFVPNSLTTLHN